MEYMKFVDLFAGCGGLSLGLERAGFELVLSVEKSEMAAETFYHNFVKRLKNKEEWIDYRSSSIENQFSNKVITHELEVLLKNRSLLDKLKRTDIDIVVGGPPCQGFSLAGRRNPDDVRNKLPWQYLEFVEAVNPKAVVIENVVGMSRSFKKSGGEPAPFEQLQQALRETGQGYVVQPVHVNAMHYGVPEHRPRLMILGLRKDIAAQKKIESTDSLWYSDFTDLLTELPSLAPAPTVKAAELRTVRDAIGDISDFIDKNPSKNAKSFLKDIKEVNEWKILPPQASEIPNQKTRVHKDVAVRRFRLYQYLRDNNLASNTLNIPSQNEERVARDLLEALYANAEFPACSPDGTLLAKDVKQLIELTLELKTKKHSQRALSWDRPSPTVVTLPDDYVHPSEPRIFTVREYARLQGFPDAFEFRSKETTGGTKRRTEVPQYSQIGNAVAPLVAYAVGKRFFDILSE